ncbi:hypothetical protein [Nocardioides sp.]|uniref:hypothetical protein n=1 Tax=Nocardioides sp. TaxID=35761 RepID=UPI00271B17A1|nr:hypothetical protein [Nocardioides sp.]MDO9458240.1 hypothetical protein [Nocardioides sp.]
MRRGLSAATVLLSVLALTAGCGDDGGGSSETETIQVTVKDGEVTPAGERIDVDVNQPVDIVVTSDEAGELHVHSSPETTKEFAAGENDPIELQFDRPGLVDVELHEPFEGPVVQLQVK